MTNEWGPPEGEPIRIKESRSRGLVPLIVLVVCVAVIVAGVAGLGGFDQRSVRSIHVEPESWVSLNNVEMKIYWALAKKQDEDSDVWKLHIDAEVRNQTDSQIAIYDITPGVVVRYTNGSGRIKQGGSDIWIVDELDLDLISKRMIFPPIKSTIPIRISMTVKDGLDINAGVTVELTPMKYVSGGYLGIDTGLHWAVDSTPSNVWVISLPVEVRL